MNEALAEWEASNGYKKPENITKAMKIIADAGYDVDSWNPLTQDYKVYWYSVDNRCILYNSKTAQVEYPTEYKNTDITSAGNAGKFYVYNQTFKKAIEATIDFNSSNASDVTINGVNYESAVVYKADNASATTYVSLVAQEETRNNEKVINYSFAFTADSTSATYQSDLAKAQKDAGEYLYTIITQANQDIINLGNITIEPGQVIDITDYSGDWKPLKSFTGHFGVTDTASGFNKDAGTPDEQYEAGTYHPVIIKGLSIDDTLSFSETYISRGANNPIYLTGFIGMVYGVATIENVRFENVTIDHAASDRTKSTSGSDASNSAIIGGISRLPGTDGATDVSIRNIVAKNVNVSAVRRSAGIVGYIGGYGEVLENGANAGATVIWGLKGTVNIDNCEFNGNVSTDANNISGQTGYAVSGGIVGYINKEGTYVSKKSTVTDGSKKTGFVGNYAISTSSSYNFAAPSSDADRIIITVSNCKVSGSLNGLKAAGIVAEYSCTGYEVAGSFNSTSKLIIENCSSTATMPNRTASLTYDSNYLVGYNENATKNDDILKIN